MWVYAHYVGVALPMVVNGEGGGVVALNRDERWSRARAQALLEEGESETNTGMAKESTMGLGAK